MEKLLNEEIQIQVKELFTQLSKRVTILFFDSNNCETCESTKQLLDEVTGLSDYLSLDIKNYNDDIDLVNKHNVERVPAFLLLDENDNDRGIRFYGIPAGHEFTSFLSAIIEIGGNESKISDSVLERINGISKPINIKVFVTLGCPHCSGAVQKAHKIAMLNSNVVGEMIEAQTFESLSNRFNVSGVPKIVINDKYELLGDQPIEEYLKIIEAI